ncbi:unnamed protein product [Dicrocoelium dendriticum]|nr:unnamed protein product [Dicrocoelium dendriticum]
MQLLPPPCHQHKKGWTTAIYDRTGGRIISAGVDGKVKVLDSVDDSCPMEHVIGEKINALVVREETIILATEGTYVHIIHLEDGLPEGLATRFTAEVMHVAVNKDGSRLATCSSDFLIKVVNFPSSEDREFVLEGHTGGVLSVAFDPLDIFLASSSCDGTVRIWRLDQRREVKVIRCLSSCNDPALALSFCRLCWQLPSGKFLAVPVDRQVCLYERDTWEVLCYLSCPSFTEPITSCVSSFDGALLVAGSDGGWIVVWRIADRHALHRVRDPSESIICSLAWHPQQEHTVLYANGNGSLGLVRIPERQPALDGGLSPDSMKALMGCDEDGDMDQLLRAAAAQAESSRLVDEEEAQRLLDLPGDDDDVDSIDLSRIKSGYLVMDDVDDGESQPLGDVLETEPKPLDAIHSVPNATGPPQPSSIYSQRIQKSFQPGSMPQGEYFSSTTSSPPLHFNESNSSIHTIIRFLLRISSCIFEFLRLTPNRIGGHHCCPLMNSL